MYPRSHGECKRPTEDRGLEQPSVSGPGTQLATQSPAAMAGAAAEDRVNGDQQERVSIAIGPSCSHQIFARLGFTMTF